MSQLDTWLQQASDAVNRGADPAKVEALLQAKMRAAGYEVETPKDNTAQVDEWYSQAKGAIDKGADEAKVQALFRSKVQSLGLQLKDGDLGLTRFGNVQGGGVSTADEVYDPESGETEAEFYDRMERKSKQATASDAERRGAQISDTGAFREGARQGAARVLKGLGIDASIPAIDYAGDVSKNIASTAGGASLGLASMLNPATAIGFGLTQGSAGAQETLDAGGTGTQAALAGGVEAALFPLARLLPAALGGTVAQRIASGVGINVASGAGGDALLNQINPDSIKRDVWDPYARGADVLLGAVAGVSSKPRSTPRVDDIPKTGDPIVDQGIKFVEDLANDQPREATKPQIDPEQTDMFSPNQESALSTDLFSGEIVPASLMERRRLRQEAAARKEEAQRTQEQDLELERDYLLDQQERLNREAQGVDEGIVSRQGDIPDPFMGLANTIPADVNAPTPRTVQLRDGEAVGAVDQQPNSAMADAMLRGWIDRGQLRNPNTPVDSTAPVQAEMFNPSRNETVDQRPVQDTFDLQDSQQDLFRGQQPQTPEVRTPEPSAPAKKNKESADLREQLKAALSSNNVLFADPSGATVNVVRAPDWIDAKLHEGTLTTNDILKEASRQLPTDTEAAKNASNLVKYLSSVADRIGGRETQHVILDRNNPEHAKVLAKHENVDNDNTVAFWDPDTNKIYYNRNIKSNTRTMLHEAVHGITSQVLHIGHNGRLPAPAQMAYSQMATAFNRVVKPALDEASAALPAGDKRTLTRYGLSDRKGKLAEFMAEFFSNGVFRNSLKDLKLSPELISKLPAPGRGFVGRVKNVYDLVVKSLSKLMASAGLRSVADVGGAKNAESAYEAMWGQIDKFFNYIDEDTASMSRQLNSRNTSPSAENLQFLGETVPQRMATDSKPELQAPRSKVVTGLRSLFAPAGIEPKVTKARNQRIGDQSAGAYRAITIINRMISGLARNPEMESRLDDVMRGVEDPAKFLADAKDEELKGAVKDFLKDRYGNSMSIARTVLDDPNATEGGLKWAIEVATNANSHVHRSYQSVLDPPKRSLFSWVGGGYINNKMKLANRAETKLGEKGSNAPLTDAQKAMLTPDEAKSLSSLRAMRAHVSAWLPNSSEAIAKLKDSDLKDRYEALTNIDPDTVTRGLPQSEHRATLEAAYMDALNKNDRTVVLDNLIKSMSGVSADRTKSLISYARNMRLGEDVMTIRNNLPPVVREFLGEIHSPVANMLRTLSDQTSQLAQLTALKSLREDGMGTIFSDKQTETHSIPLTGEKMYPLRGLFVTPDVAKAMDSLLKIDQSAGDLVDAAVADVETGSLLPHVVQALAKPAKMAATAKKMATVVFNPGRWVMNLAGSPAQAITNGNINVASWGRGARAVYKAMLASKRKITDPDVEDLFRYGVLEPTSISEIYQGLGHRDILALERKLGKLDTPGDSLKAVWGTFLDISKEGYAATDLWSKAANFFNDVDKWKAHNKKIGKEMSDEQLKRFVAERINNTNITPSRSPIALKNAERYGVTAYGTYQFETFRTTINNVGTGYFDAMEGIKTGDVEMARYGIQRMLGAVPAMIYAQAAYHGGVVASLGLLGYAVSSLTDDDPRKKFLDLDDSKLGSGIAVIKDENGKEYTFDSGSIPPMDPVMKPTVSAIKAIAALGDGDTKAAEEHLKNVGKQIWSLVSTNAAWRDASNVVTGKEPPLKKSNPEAYEAWEKQAQDFGLDKEVYDRILNALNVVTPKGYTEYKRGQSEETEPGIKTLISTGVGVRPLNPEKDLRAKSYFGQSRKQELLDARKGYMNMLKQGFDANPEKVEERFVEGLKDSAKAYNELRIAVDAAKAQGKSNSDIAKSLKDLAIGEEAMGSLLRGRKFPVSVMIADMERDLQTKLLEAGDDPEKRNEARARYRTNTKMLVGLFKKYKNIDIEDL